MPATPLIDQTRTDVGPPGARVTINDVQVIHKTADELACMLEGERAAC